MSILLDTKSIKESIPEPDYISDKENDSEDCRGTKQEVAQNPLTEKVICNYIGIRLNRCTRFAKRGHLRCSYHLHTTSHSKCSIEGCQSATRTATNLCSAHRLRRTADQESDEHPELCTYKSSKGLLCPNKVITNNLCCKHASIGSNKPAHDCALVCSRQVMGENIYCGSHKYISTALALFINLVKAFRTSNGDYMTHIDYFFNRLPSDERLLFLGKLLLLHGFITNNKVKPKARLGLTPEEIPELFTYLGDSYNRWILSESHSQPQ